MSRLVTLAGYVVVLAAALAVEVDARRRSGATFGDALALVLRPWPVRVAVVAAWLWLGWHLFVRVDWR
jgi:Family of unknown function (DUF6186)